MTVTLVSVVVQPTTEPLESMISTMVGVSVAVTLKAFTAESGRLLPYSGLALML